MIMNFKNPKYILFGIVTFIIVFLMNYIGNDAPDKLYRAILTASVSAVAFIIGLWIYDRRDKNDERNNFD